MDPFRGAEPIPAISRNKGVTEVKITLFHSKAPKALALFIYFKLIRYIFFDGLQLS
jgi:cyclophilin family peptidyl-prolyl cis-trans isomerase